MVNIFLKTDNQQPSAFTFSVATVSNALAICNADSPKSRALAVVSAELAN
jgi:hypothetical protein